MALDHVGFGVKDYPASREFYLAALAPLGMVIHSSAEDWVMLCDGGEPQFFVGSTDAAGPPPGHIHLAFRAATRAAVDEFHAAALAAGGQDNGPPGLRADYSPNYYAAFITDLNGHNLEAVCYLPGDAA